MGTSPYKDLEVLSLELRRLAETDRWEDAQVIASKLQSQSLPIARPMDRASIETVLENFAAVMERASPLRDDIARLLAAFGGTQAENSHGKG